MGRQPLGKRAASGYSLGGDSLAQRPKAAALIAQCTAFWTELEFQVARLLAAMLHANTAGRRDVSRARK